MARSWRTCNARRRRLAHLDRLLSAPAVLYTPPPQPFIRNGVQLFGLADCMSWDVARMRGIPVRLLQPARR